MTNPKPTKTLIVVSPENSKLAADLFDTNFDLAIATSSAEAKNLLSEPHDLIVASTCFDESRMFDFLRYCKASQVFVPIPFVAVRVGGLGMDDMIHQAIQIATKALGAEEYIDLQRLPKLAHEKSRAFRQLLSMLIAKKRFDI